MSSCICGYARDQKAKALPTAPLGKPNFFYMRQGALKSPRSDLYEPSTATVLIEGNSNPSADPSMYTVAQWTTVLHLVDVQDVAAKALCDVPFSLPL